MKIAIQTVAVFLIFMGLMAIAGAGGDCDGKCGAGNTISEMLMIMAIGISMLSTGGFILIKGDK